MGILRTDRVSGLGGANAIKGSVKFTSGGALDIDLDGATIGTSNFTIEAWVFWFGNYFHQFTGSSSNNFNFYITNDDGDLKFWNGSSTYDFDASPVRPNEWTHVALVREGTSTSQTKVYVNGVNTNSITLPTSFSFDRLLSGINYLDGSTAYGNGYTSNLRVTLDAVYTSAFTPPSSELTVLDNTIVLCCQSPSNILQEATGKTIVPFKHGVNQGDAVASHFTPNSPVGFSTTTDVGTQFGSTFDGVTTFDSQAYMVPPGGNARERNRGRGLHAGGENPTHCNIIDFIQIQSGGISEDFGDLLTVSNSCDGVSSNTRAVFATYDAPTYNSLEFVTMATTGNATDFGDQTISTGQEGSLSNATRGLFAGGYGGAAQVFVNTVEFITIPTLGNAQDFGNLREAIVGVGGASDTTRGLFAGGVVPGAYRANIDQFTIATTGDATDFGDLSVARRNPAGTSDSTRGVFFGGNDSGGTNVIDFVTIQSAGDATDFGDSTSNQTNASGASDSIRGVFSAGYYGSPHLSNVIEKVIIQTKGNSVDYGDLIDERIQGGSVSDSHGGL